MNDRLKVEALRQAKKFLDKRGWSYTPHKLGETAAEILAGMGDYAE